MKSLDELIVTESRTTANFADYVTCAPYLCCGNMDLHDDSDNNQGKPFTITPVYWEPGYVLLLTVDDIFVIVEPTEQPITFNSSALHGFMPREVANELVINQDDAGPLYQQFEENCNIYTEPKLVWLWTVL